MRRPTPLARGKEGGVGAKAENPFKRANFWAQSEDAGQERRC